jgi:Tfp pilus assembly protein PilZ
MKSHERALPFHAPGVGSLELEGRCAISTLPRTGRVCERCTPSIRCGARAAIERRRGSQETVIELVVEPPERPAAPIPLTRRTGRESTSGRHSAHRNRDSQGQLPPVEIGRLIRIDRGSADALYCGLDGRIRSGGIFLATSAPREIGTPIALSFIAPGMVSPYSATGRVAWVREDDPATIDAVPGMGIALGALGPLPPHVEHALDRLLATRDPIFYESWLPGETRP